jgi:hypothetical protein
MAWQEGRMKQIICVALIATAIVSARTALANESSTAIGLCGLKLRQNAAVSMDSEDLYISREKAMGKSKPDNFVSFCMDGVKKIGPTQFEVRKSNFEPAKDLNILIVEFFEPDAS